MCDIWKKNYSKEISCEGLVLDSGDGEYTVKGTMNSLGNSTIMYWAPNPPTYCSSYSGSGLPYPNPNIAYENTPNRGVVKTSNGKFEFKLRYPNSYYIGLGSVYVKPVCHIKICDDKKSKIHTIELGHGIPFRMLTYQQTPFTISRDSPNFYKGGFELPVRTQEQVLRDSGYPEENKMPNNFWGLRPPSC